MMEDTTRNELTTATLSGNLDELLCIEYPGIKITRVIKIARKLSAYCFISQGNVENVDKAIDTLGGETSIAKVYAGLYTDAR